MSKCIKIRRPNRKVCIGDLSEQIEIKTRSILPPSTNSVDFGMSLVTTSTVAAMLETKRGEAIFDSVDVSGGTIQQSINYLFYIYFIPDVTFEDMVTFKGKNFRIINSEDLDGRSQFYLLRCSIRGNEALGANQF